MKILVPVDGSPVTKHMLAYLAAHDEWLGEHHDYTLLHVAPAVPARAASAIGKEVLKAYYADESTKVFKPIRSFFDKQGLRASFVAKVGSAADTISEMADKDNVDLVIMGSHGHGALGGLVLGSVTTKVLAHSKAPVLVVR